MTSTTSKIASAPGPKGLAAGFRAFFASHFHACVVCASEHGVYFENSPLSAGAGVPPRLSAERSTQGRARVAGAVGADTGPSRTGPTCSFVRGVRWRTWGLLRKYHIRSHSAEAGVNPNIVGPRAPLLNAQHKDGLGSPAQSGRTPAPAERILRYRAARSPYAHSASISHTSPL